MSNTFNICIVDDDDIFQFTMAKILESVELSKKVIAFSDGEEALNFMLDKINNENELPDVIMLDINMPIMDGFQFMDEFVKIKPKVGKNITVYMISSSVDPVDIDRAKSISAVSDYILKPIKPNEFRELIHKLEKKGRL